jgi:tetratricopeptide (TPR) repeat protein
LASELSDVARTISTKLDDDWLKGRASLGAASSWKPEEIRLVAELGYGLAQQGRNEEAITIFEGLAALAPATAYFQAALGALRLRVGDLEIALNHLNAALEIDPTDISALTSKGEVLMRLGHQQAAISNLECVLRYADGTATEAFVVRARALLAQLTGDLA